MRTLSVLLLAACGRSSLTLQSDLDDTKSSSDTLTEHTPPPPETIDDGENDPPPAPDPDPEPDPEPDPDPPQPQPGNPTPPPPTPLPPTPIPPTPPPPTPAPIPPAATTDVCFPGPAMDWSVCLPTVDASQVGYNYPGPLNGNQQYGTPSRYLDLQSVSASTQLAPNFTLDEIAQEWKGRYAVVQPHAVDRLQDMRDALGPLAVNSGYRNPTYNDGVGGATWSRHMYGDAFDLDPVNVSLGTLESTCHAHGAGYVGVYATHMHCDWRDDALDAVFYGVIGTQSSIVQVPILDGAILRGVDTLLAPASGWDEGEPLREWIAFDADGYAIDTHTGESYTWPEGTDSVEVWIGRAVVRTMNL